MAHPLSREGHLARLAATRPTRDDLAHAERVLSWLSDHASLFPLEYSEDAAIDLQRAANECHVDPAELLLTAEEFATRDAHNARVISAREERE